MSPFRFLLVSFGFGAIVFSLVSYGASADWFRKPTMIPEIVGLNVVVTFAIYRWLVRIQGAPLFINSYLLSIVMKLILYSGFLLIIRIFTPQALNANAVLLLICYIIFTILEVTILFQKTGR
jgi:hypothetical protein